MTLSDDNQAAIAHSFTQLFIPTGASRPREPRSVIAQRYELCEDRARMLTQHARAKLVEPGVTEPDMLQRMHRGLPAEGSGLTGEEAGSVTCRLAERLDWPLPAWATRP